MADKSKAGTGGTKNAAKILELEQEIEQLKKDDAPPVEFPKYISDPTDPTGQRGSTVNNADEEKAFRAGQKGSNVESADQKLKAAEIEEARNPTAPGVQKVQIVNPPALNPTLPGKTDKNGRR